MWARIATFEDVDVGALRERAGQRPPDDLIPRGMRGLLSLIDPERRRQVFITLFESREAIEAAEPQFERMGAAFPEELRGRRVSKEYCEVAAGFVTIVGEVR